MRYSIYLQPRTLSFRCKYILTLFFHPRRNVLFDFISQQHSQALGMDERQKSLRRTFVARSEILHVSESFTEFSHARIRRTNVFAYMHRQCADRCSCVCMSLCPHAFLLIFDEFEANNRVDVCRGNELPLRQSVVTEMSKRLIRFVALINLPELPPLLCWGTRNFCTL